MALSRHDSNNAFFIHGGGMRLWQKSQRSPNQRSQSLAKNQLAIKLWQDCKN